VEIYETEEKLTKVRDSYFAAFEKMADCETVKIINGERSVEEISAEIEKFVIEKIIQI
jgi:thymidylate kinase